MKVGLLGLFLLVSSVGMAESFKVSGRDYVYSCGYFSSMVGDYEVTFKDEGLPWGTKLTLIYGWDVDSMARRMEPKEWKDRQEVEMKAVAPFTWSTKIQATLHSRTEAEYRRALDLVVKVEVPKDRVRYYNGGSEMGFFQIEVGTPGKAPCIGRDGKKPEFTDRLIKVVTRR